MSRNIRTLNFFLAVIAWFAIWFSFFSTTHKIYLTCSLDPFVYGPVYYVFTFLTNILLILTTYKLVSAKIGSKLIKIFLVLALSIFILELPLIINVMIGYTPNCPGFGSQYNLQLEQEAARDMMGK